MAELKFYPRAVPPKPPLLPSPPHAAPGVCRDRSSLAAARETEGRGERRSFKATQQVHGRAALASFQRQKLVNQKQPLNCIPEPRTERERERGGQVGKAVCSAQPGSTLPPPPSVQRSVDSGQVL